MIESDIIARICSHFTAQGLGSLRLGVGDDAAVLRPPGPDEELLATTDQVIEGRHFVRDLHPPEDLGRATLARGVSDIAAMGGRPAWFLLSLGLPEWALTDWLDRYAAGMAAALAEFDLPDCPLAGGDLSADDRFHAHITVIGTAPIGSAMLRSAAQPGDHIYVSGSLGGSALGLNRLREGFPLDDPAVQRHLRPTPRLELGRFLRESGVRAAMDVSDGLSRDLGRLAAASALGARVDLGRLPVFSGADPEQALHSGEEYELLFTAPSDLRLPSECGGLPLTAIGEMTRETGLILIRDGRESALAVQGFDHFQS